MSGRPVSCREVLPGLPTRRKPLKTDLCDRLQSLTGIDPMRFELYGQKALHLIGRGGAGPGAEGSAPMSLPFIVQFQYLLLSRRARARVSLDGLLRYTHRNEIAVKEPGHAAEPFAEQSSESHTAAVRGCVEADRVSREVPARD